MPDDDAPRGESILSALLPTIVLVLLALVIGGGVLLFPRMAAYIAQQDCVASGHTNCVPAK